MAKETQPLLSVRNLKQYFKSGVGRTKLIVKAIDDVSFDIYPGEVFSLVGESGCGKTTTGRTIIKLYDPTDGEVFFMGKRISAGVLSLKEAIRSTRKRTAAEVKQIKTKIQDEISEITGEARGKQAITAAKLKIKQLKRQYKKMRKEYMITGRGALVPKLEKDYSDNLLKAQGVLEKAMASYEKEVARVKAADVTKSPEQKAKEKKMIDEVKAKHQKDIDAINDERDEEIKKYKKEIRMRKKITADVDTELMKNMQMIFQDPIASLNPRMTVKEIIAEGLRIAGERSNKVILKKVNKVLETVGMLPEHASRYPHEFSGGQRQRIGIARALIVSPEFIIADEPISALDVSIQAQVINLLNDLRDELGITIMFIAHDLSVVKYFSDRIGVMYYGKLVELADKNELFKNPLHPYTRSLLSAVPMPDPNYEKQRQRIKYDPSMHDYAEDKPTLYEIKKGHFVYANDAEIKAYKKELKD